MKRTNQTPTRRLPVRAAKVRGNSNPVNPTTPRPGGRLTRSSAAAFALTPSPSGSASKRAASPDPAATPNKRTRRDQIPTGHYADASDGDVDDEQSNAESSHAFDVDSDDEPLFSPAKKTKFTPVRTKTTPVKSKQTPTTTPGRPATQTPGGSTAVTKPQHQATEDSGESDKPIVSISRRADDDPPVIPPWVNLPYYVLLRIFECAAGAPITLSAAKWLLDTSVVCHAFTEPALTALYRIPPVLTPHMAHGLASLLSKSPDETTFNYRQKVKCLEMEAGNVVSKTFRGQALNFKALLNHAPRLTEVYLWHEKDQAPYRDLYENIKWMYPLDMYRALGVAFSRGPRSDISVVPIENIASVPKLRSWMWNRRMLGGLPLQNLRELHKFPAFHGLRKLVLTNFQLASVTSRVPDDPEIVEADTQLVDKLAQSITVLPDLTHLVVECSTAVNGRFLSQLPKSIEHLELVCCWEVTADHFAEYLVSHGNALRRLTLHHNQSLSLAWLPVLGAACPRLESLRMNMTYYSILSSYNTSDPAYDRLLTADQVPTWPAALMYLDLKNLRRWDKPAAEAFLQSLLDGAPSLLNLRHLEIKAMLDISIRERAKLRDEWEAKLKRVFLRKWVDPLPHFTLRPRHQVPEAARAHTSEEAHHHKTKKRAAAQAGPDTASPRRSGRIANLPSVSSSRASSTGRDIRRGPGARPTYAEPGTDEDIILSETSDDDDDDDRGDKDGSWQRSDHPHDSRRGGGPTATAAAGEVETPFFVQGLCTTVDVRFDNQKPVEQPFQMGDFLDDSSDDPTDEDWSEDAAGYASDHGHAW